MATARTFGGDCVNWKSAVGGSYAAPGILNGQFDAMLPTNWEEIRGTNHIFNEVGDLFCDVSIPLWVTSQTKGVLTAAVRASGSVYHGAQNEAQYWQIADPNYGVVLANAVTNSIELAWSGGPRAPWSANIGVMCRQPEFTATASQVAPSSTVRYLGGDTTITILGMSGFRSFRLRLNNGYSYTYLGDGRGVGEERFPDDYDQGLEGIEVEVESEQPLDYDPSGASPGHAVDISVVLNNGVATITVAVADAGLTGPPLPVRTLTNGRKVYRSVFHCNLNSLTIS